MQAIDQAYEKGAKIVAFPELCVTGYTCGDLFTQNVLLNAAYGAVKKIAGHTKGKNILAFVGMPLTEGGKLYNTAAAVNDGKVIGFTTKTFLPNYGEFYEMRQFTPGPDSVRWIQFDGEKVPFGPKILFQDDETADLIVARKYAKTSGLLFLRVLRRLWQERRSLSTVLQVTKRSEKEVTEPV